MGLALNNLGIALWLFYKIIWAINTVPPSLLRQLPNEKSAESLCRRIIPLEQLRTIDKRRLGNYIGRLKDGQMQALEQALAISLGLRGLP